MASFVGRAQDSLGFSGYSSLVDEDQDQDMRKTGTFSYISDLTNSSTESPKTTDDLPTCSSSAETSFSSAQSSTDFCHSFTRNGECDSKQIENNHPGACSSKLLLSVLSDVIVFPFSDLEERSGSSPSDPPPLRKIEDFVSKSMAKKVAVRRNIRGVKSLKELNPETRKALEEENQRILELEANEIATTEVPLDDSPADAEVEVTTIEIADEPTPRSLILRAEEPSSPASSDEIIALTPPINHNNDVIFVGNKERYPSVSSFHCDDAENKVDENGRVLINTGRTKRDPCIFVADHLVPHLKPHQIGGIRFMYATLIESVSKFVNSPGNGAVLAHSMGLGKTLQVIAFLDAIFRHTTAKSVLIVAPLNTMAHWMAEFTKWMPVEQRHERMKVVCIRDQKTAMRNSLIKAWGSDGGVLLIGYEKLRAIVDKGAGCCKKRKLNGGGESSKSVENIDENEAEMTRLILEAGQIIICDEGHRIKSADAAITRVLKKVTARRRLILTGYPLQNNLMEYWCMIDFVRPFLLGTEPEFANLFKNPIENGQCADSSEHDRKVMRQRTYILQRTLCRIVQRRDSRPLIAELPKKREFAIIFRQTPSQGSLYRSLFEELTRHRDSLNAVALYTTFRNITHHPAIFFTHLKKMAANNDATNGQDGSGPIRQLLINLVQQGKWERFIANLNTFRFDEIHSGKILFLKFLVEEAVVKLREKIIIFSQSIDVLDYLKEYVPTLLPPVDVVDPPDYPQTFRIDGATTSYERERLINLFNDDEHLTKVFLISTEAGGIGINLTGACRVVLMDVSWNPSKDIQAISRIYRYGQRNVSTIYRLVGDGSMERCVFDRQIHKQFLFKRVVDDKSPMLAVNQADLAGLFQIDNLCGPAEWHRICEDPFPEEAKADDILGQLDTNLTFRQYLSGPPMVMDSILEADDTAQLSEYERREAESNFLREKRPDGSGNNRRPGVFPGRMANFTPPQGSQGGFNGFYRASPPLSNLRPIWPLPSLRPQLSTVPQPSSRTSNPGAVPRAQPVRLEMVVRDSVALNEIRILASRKEDFGEPLQRYAALGRMRCSRHVVPDREGTPSVAYTLQPPGVAFSFVFKADGTVWQMMHPPVAAPVPSGSSSRGGEVSQVEQLQRAAELEEIKLT